MSKKNTPAKRAARKDKVASKAKLANKKAAAPPARAPKLPERSLGAKMSALAQACEERAEALAAAGGEGLGAPGVGAASLFAKVPEELRSKVVEGSRRNAMAMMEVDSSVARETFEAMRAGAGELEAWCASLADAGPWARAIDRALSWQDVDVGGASKMGLAVLRARALEPLCGQSRRWTQAGFEQLRGGLANVLGVDPSRVHVDGLAIDFESDAAGAASLARFGEAGQRAIDRALGQGLGGELPARSDAGAAPSSEAPGWLGFSVLCSFGLSELAGCSRDMEDKAMDELIHGRMDYFSSLLAERLASASGGAGSPMTFRASREGDAEPVEFVLEGIDDPMSALLAGSVQDEGRAKEAVAKALGAARVRCEAAGPLGVVMDMGMLYAERKDCAGAEPSVMVSFCAQDPAKSFGVAIAASSARRVQSIPKAVVAELADWLEGGTALAKGSTFRVCPPRSTPFANDRGALLFPSPQGLRAMEVVG